MIIRPLIILEAAHFYSVVGGDTGVVPDDGLALLGRIPYHVPQSLFLEPDSLQASR